MFNIHWLYLVSLLSHSHVYSIIFLCVLRHPSAAVDSVKSVAPPRGGGAHRSGVSGLDRALRRKRYLHLTASEHFRRSICKAETLYESVMCFWQVGWPNCTLGLILLRPFSLTCSSLLEEAGSSLMVRQTHVYSWIISVPSVARGHSHRNVAKPVCSHIKHKLPPAAGFSKWAFISPVSFLFISFPNHQGLSTRSWEESWPSASQPTSSTETRLLRPK